MKNEGKEGFKARHYMMMMMQVRGKKEVKAKSRQREGRRRKESQKVSQKGRWPVCNSPSSETDGERFTGEYEDGGDVRKKGDQQGGQIGGKEILMTIVQRKSIEKKKEM